MEKKRIPLPADPIQKPQKSAKKTVLFAQLSVWLCFGGAAYSIIALSFNIPEKSILGICFLCELVAFICAVIGILQIVASKSMRSGIRYCLVAIIVSLLIYSELQNFIRFPARAVQSEAKQNLGSIFTAYQAYHSNYHTFSISPSIQVGNTANNCLSIAGWEPSGIHRYAYQCMNTVAFSGSRAKNCPPEIITSATKDSFTIAACGNVDNDATVDVWKIDDAKHLKNVIDDVKR